MLKCGRSGRSTVQKKIRSERLGGVRPVARGGGVRGGACVLSWCQESDGGAAFALADVGVRGGWAAGKKIRTAAGRGGPLVPRGALAGVAFVVTGCRVAAFPVPGPAALGRLAARLKPRRRAGCA